MDQDAGIELGLGFYLIILPLVVSISLELFVKPLINRIRERIENNRIELSRIKKWLQDKF